MRDESQSQPGESNKAQRRELLRRFTVMGGALGLIVGLFEAGLLYTTPRVPTLLRPDVHAVVWLLAPSVAMTIFGALGLALGWTAGRGKDVGPGKSAIFGAAMLGAVGAYMAMVVGLLHVRTGDTLAVENLAVPAVWFVVVFAYALFAVGIFSRHVARLFRLETTWPLRPLAKVLVTAMAISILGLAFCLAYRSTRVVPVQAGPSAVVRGPNIVLITLDTVRADHLSAYGYHRPTTPNLDRLAAQGVLFENALAPSPWTLTTHASILTGLLPHQHGADWAIPLDSAPWTLAEILRSQGYETAAFTANLYYGQGGWGMAYGFDVYGDDSSSLRHNLAMTLAGRALVQPLFQHHIRYDLLNRRDAQEINRDVVRWFQHRLTRPYFVFINYFDAHDPYLAPSPYAGRFGRISEGAVRMVNSIDGIQAGTTLPADAQESLIAGYDNCLAFLDDQVGRLIRFLAVSPDWPNTVVIITSDHGEAFGEHGVYGHGWDLYREVLHVPLIIVGPGIPSGLRIAHTARIRELFATVLDLALGERPPFRRTSLRRFWTPGFRPEPFDEVAVSELIPNLRGAERVALISLMTSEWHYLADSRGGSELYYWPTDRQEKANLVDSPAHRHTVQELRERLWEHVALSLPPWRGPEYLSALDRPGHSFLREVAFSSEWRAKLLAPQLRVGISQAAFGPARSSSRQGPRPPDEDLLKSLPYH